MATYRIPILGAGTQPDTSGKVWFEPSSILASTPTNHLVLRIDQDGTNSVELSTRAGVYGFFMVPKNYIGTPKIIVVHQTTKIANRVVFEVDWKAVAQGESLDVTFATDVAAAVTVPGTAHWSKEVSITLTAEALAPDDTVVFYLVRDGGDANDDLAGASLIVGAYFEYADA